MAGTGQGPSSSNLLPTLPMPMWAGKGDITATNLTDEAAVQTLTDGAATAIGTLNALRGAVGVRLLRWCLGPLCG
jgi:hypothetical protein